MQRKEISNSLIVSCQPVPGGAMDNADFVAGFAKAALDAGARALRIESVAYVRTVRRQVGAPIIGIVKRDLRDSPVRITPFIEDAVALADAGADVVAFDATDRIRPVPVDALVGAIKARGKLTMADCSSFEDAERALAAGVDFVGTTLSGYVGGPEPVEPDFALITAMRKLTPYVIAEGRIRSPEQASEAVRAGAYAVVVGSAITRTEHATSWFHEAIDRAFAAREGRRGPVLAIDIGGTKTMAALVRGDNVLENIVVPTERQTGPDAWLAALAKHTSPWRGRYARVGIAVTGFIQDGCWSALNQATLGIPDCYPLVERASMLLGAPAFAVNDAQAAAWGEFKFGAGQGNDLVFLTISTGIGGGIIVNGRVLTGLAGHFGLIRSPSQGAAPLEDETSGRWMAVRAQAAGHDMDGAGVFAEARRGADWAKAIVSQSAARVATLCHDIQLMLDPKQIVIGGGIGLAEGYLDEVRRHLVGIAPGLVPRLLAAKLGSRAGIIGAADLAGEGR